MTIVWRERMSLCKSGFVTKETNYEKQMKREEISRMQSAFLQTEEKHSAELARLQNTIHEMEEKKEAELARLRNALFEMHVSILVRIWKKPTVLVPTKHICNIG